MWIKLTILVALGLVLFGGYRVGSAAVFLETAQYELALKEGDLEIRDYPELPVVTTPMKSGRDNTAFRKLFQFIQGDNARQEKIAMTTPVFVDDDGAEGRMSFVVPEETERRGIPEPNSEQVTVEKRPVVRVAVYRFSGVANEESRQEALRKLRNWMNQQKLRPEGDPIFAYYDAPFIPGPLRRNEAMLQIQ
jgi:DNA gyrase inhibitor GyrI